MTESLSFVNVNSRYINANVRNLLIKNVKTTRTRYCRCL